jgi:cation:H+ antiporter
MFEEVGLIGNALILLASLAFLVVASELTINNAVKVSSKTGFGKTSIGFILVGFSTSLPELSVSIFAVINPANIGLSIGNVLGSNIVDIALVLGVCLLLVALKRPRFTYFYPAMAKEELGSLHFGLFVASIIPLALLYIGYASRIIGVILLSIFVVYMLQLSRVKRIRDEGAIGAKGRLRTYASFALIGAIAVVASAFFIIESASFIATSVGVPPVVIGATIVAFGTSIPELATSLSSVRKGHLDLALGNIVGSCFINITCILGVALIASPLRINMTAFSNLALFSLIINMFLWYFLSSEKMSWREGTLLLVLYAVFLVVSFTGSSF